MKFIEQGFSKVNRHSINRSHACIQNRILIQANRIIGIHWLFKTKTFKGSLSLCPPVMPNDMMKLTTTRPNRQKTAIEAQHKLITHETFLQTRNDRLIKTSFYLKTLHAVLDIFIQCID